MSIAKVNHSVWKPWTGEDGALDAVGGSAPTLTSEWYDSNGHVDGLVSWVVASAGAVDADVIMHVSPMGYHELNELGSSVATTDYEVVSIVEAETAEILASVSSDDVARLGKPRRSIRFVIDNDSAAAVTSFKVFYEGWS